MLFRFLLLFSLCFAFQTNAQYVDETAKKPTKYLEDAVEITMGTEFKDVKRSAAQSFIGFIDGHGYMLKKHKNDYYVDRIDGDLELVGSTELQLEYQNNDLDFEEAVIFHNKLYVISSYKNKDKKRKYLFAQQLDAESLKPEGDMQKISELSFADGSSRRSGTFSYAFSQDSSLAMILYDVPGNKDSRERFGMQVYTKDFELLWEEEAFLPYKEKDFEILEQQLDNEGVVYILGKKLAGGKDKKGVPEGQMEVLKYSSKSEDPDILRIAVEGKFVSEVYLGFKKNEIVVLGFYSNDYKAGVQGCFVQSIDRETNTLLHESLQEFPMDFIVLNTTEKEQRKTQKKADKGKEVGMANLYIRKVINHKNEQFIVIAEEYQLVVVTTTTPIAGGGMTQTTTYKYYYSDIVMFSINAQYNIQWFQKIPKTQITANDDGFYSSFFVQQTPERLLFVYNDNAKNLHLVQSGKPEVFNGKQKNSLAVAVTVDYEGNVGKTSLFSIKQEDIFLRPKACGEGQDDEMIIFAQTKKYQRYGKVRVKQTKFTE